MGEQKLLYNPGFDGILANNGLTHSAIQVVAPIANSSDVQSRTVMANRFEQLLESGDFVHVLGDAHFYSTHVRPLQDQLLKTPKPSPILKINSEKKDIDAFVADDFKLIGYNPHQKIEMKMAV